MQSMGNSGDHSVNFNVTFNTSPTKEAAAVTGLITGDILIAYAQLGGLTPNQESLNKLNAGLPFLFFQTQQNKEVEQHGSTKQNQRAEGAGGDNPVEIIKANQWFQPNMMVALSINLTEMAKQMQESRISELGATLGAMNMVWEFSQNVKTMILAAGAAESAMKMMEGAAGLIQAAGGVACAGIAAKASVAKTGGSFHTFVIAGGGGQAMAQIVNGSSQAVNGFVQSGLILQKTEAEAEKEVADTLKQLSNQILQSANDARRELEDILTKALDMLKSVNEQNARAHNNFLTHA